MMYVRTGRVLLFFTSIIYPSELENRYTDHC